MNSNNANQSSEQNQNTNVKVLTQATPRLSKTVIIGDSFVGKTSIIARLTSDTFSETKPTIGATHQVFKTLNKQGEEIVLDLWDTAGQERFRSVVPMFYKGSKAIIIVFDITNQDSFEGAKRWVEEIESYNSNAVLSVIGNKVDLQDQRKVTMETARIYANQHKASYFECSAKDNIGIREVFEDIAERIPKWNETNNKLTVNDVKPSSSNGICCS
jgi:small GTP-binding protein